MLFIVFNEFLKVTASLVKSTFCSDDNFGMTQQKVLEFLSIRGKHLKSSSEKFES